MRRLCLAVALLVLIPSLAEARYRTPLASEVLGGSKLIVIGEVESVGEADYTVKVTEQVIGSKKAPEGQITIARRRRSLRRPADPSAIAPGTVWVWVLEPLKAAEPYRSMVSPLQIKGGRVHYAQIADPGAASPATMPTVEVFKALVKRYRQCFSVDTAGVATRLVSPEAVNAFAASSPYAGRLVQETAVRSE